MGSFDKTSVTPEQEEKPRASSPFAGIGERLARTFAPVERSPRRDLRYRAEPEPPPAWDGVDPRFPISRQGYDCAIVDEHVAELEREAVATTPRFPPGCRTCFAALRRRGHERKLPRSERGQA